MNPAGSIHCGDALVIVDVQNDFLPGGALAVQQGDEVIPVLNRYIALFEQQHLPIFATRDWHPANHCSFQGQGGAVAETLRDVLVRRGVFSEAKAFANKHDYFQAVGGRPRDLFRVRGNGLCGKTSN
jgi:nicotinamidase-related amidase